MNIIELKYATKYPNMTLRGCMVLLILLTRETDFGKISAKLGISKPALSRTLDTLGHYGLVKRTRNENDGRFVDIVLTTEGYKLALKISSSQNALVPFP